MKAQLVHFARTPIKQRTIEYEEGFIIGYEIDFEILAAGLVLRGSTRLDGGEMTVKELETKLLDFLQVCLNQCVEGIEPLLKLKK